MWFLIGILTTIGCVGYFFHKKIKASWKGINATCNNISYEYHVIRDKKRIKKIKLGIKSVGKFDFFIKSEKWHDRFFKWLGLSVEFQLGNQDFDKKYYVVSDDVPLLESIAREGKLHSVIDRVFSSPKYCAKTKELRCNSKRLWLEYKCDDSFSEDDISEIAATIVPSLNDIADHLVAEEKEGRAGFDRYAVRAAIILGISTGLAVNGIFHFVRMQWIKIPFTVDTSQLMLNGFLASAIIIFFLVFGTICFLGRTSRAHLVFIEVLLIGGVGAFLTSTEELSDFNIEMDNQIAQEIVLQVRRKSIQHHRKAPDSYYLHVDNWLDRGKEKKIDVGSGFYYRVKEGEYVAIFQKPGRLGYRWVESVSKAKNPNEDF